MKIKGLNGKTYTWKLTGYVPLKDDETKRSKYHLLARELLYVLFPAERILEEIPLPGSDGLTADFYIPSRKLMIEVQGEQHYKFIRHFHGNYLNFLAGKKRDSKKKEWCALNKIFLVELPFLEDLNGWKDRINRYNERNSSKD